MLAEILHKIASMEHENEDPKYYPRPSLAGPQRCIRSLVYWGLGVERQPFPGRTFHIFDDGLWHEELMANWIRKSAFQLHSEQMKVDCGTVGDIHLQGHIDGVLTDPTGRDHLWEAKGLNHFTCQRYWGGSELPLDYITQCCLYLRGLKQVTEIEDAILLIKNKNTSAYLEFEILLQEDDTAVVRHCLNSQGEKKELNTELPEITGHAFQKFQEVHDYAEAKVLPKRQYHINDDFQCSYCNYGQICWANYKEEFAELSTKALLPDNVADTVRYYKELGAQKSEMEGEYKQLAKQIKDILKEAGAREGQAGEYLIRNVLVEQERLDKELLTPAEIARATKKSMYERLYIKNMNK
jgi:hypothetical protein